MVDPLSIAASSAALAQLCIKIIAYVADVRIVDDGVQSLHQGLSALSEVLISLSLAWNSNPEITAAQDGPDKPLWVSVKDNISNCTAVLQKFKQRLDKVSKEDSAKRNILQRTVVKAKFSISAGELTGYRMEIEAYHRVIGIGLNAITTSVLHRNNRSDNEVSQRVANIEAGIAALNRNLRKRRELSVNSSSNAGTQSLEKFVSEAQTFHSRASTYSSEGTRTVISGSVIEVAGSEIGEQLSEDKLRKIDSWIGPSSKGSNSVTAAGSETSWSGSVSDVESLPQLMSMLENATQSFHRFHAIEKQKTSGWEDEISALKEKCAKYEAKVRFMQQQHDHETQDFKYRIHCMSYEFEEQFQQCRKRCKEELREVRDEIRDQYEADKSQFDRTISEHVREKEELKAALLDHNRNYESNIEHLHRKYGAEIVILEKMHEEAKDKLVPLQRQLEAAEAAKQQTLEALRSVVKGLESP